MTENQKELHKQYLSFLRHELRTPLNVIIGYGEMMLEDTEDKGMDKYSAWIEAIISLGHQINEEIRVVLLQPDIESDSFNTGALRLDVQSQLTPSVHKLVNASTFLLDTSRIEEIQFLVGYAEKLYSASQKLQSLLQSISTLTTETIPANKFKINAIQNGSAGVVEVTKSDNDRRKDPGGHILVVDDIEANRDILIKFLGRRGYTVHTAENGQVAWDLLRQQPFDLVLLDVMMPVMDGIQTLKMIKNDEELKRIPVIMLSAADDLENVVRCIEMGAVDYLSKPFNRVLLQARIDASLEKKRFNDLEADYLQQIEKEKKNSEDLLRVILPEDIVIELQSTNKVVPRRYENVGVLFCDIVGFTPYSEANSPEKVVSELQQLVEIFEDLSDKYKLEKIKTIGDAYMAAAGLMIPVENPVENCIRCGLEMISSMNLIEADWRLRVGVHIGPVIAGVVGRKKYLFDLWGDTVNTASRVESHGEPNTLYVSTAAWEQVTSIAVGQSAGIINIKGKGPMELFKVHSIN